MPCPHRENLNKTLKGDECLNYTSHYSASIRTCYSSLPFCSVWFIYVMHIPYILYTILHF